MARGRLLSISALLWAGGLGTALAGLPLWLAVAALLAAAILVSVSLRTGRTSPPAPSPQAERGNENQRAGYTPSPFTEREWPKARGEVAAIVLLANIALGLTLLWSLDERTEITLRIGGGLAVVEVDGVTASTHRLTASGGRVGLYLEDYRSARSYAGPAVTLGGPAGLIQAMGDAGQRSPFGPAWRDLRLNGQPVSMAATDLSGSPGGWSTNGRRELAPAERGWLLLPEDPGGSYALQLTLVRGAYPAGLLAGVDRAGEGEILLLRPEHRELIWREWRGGEMGRDTAHSATFSKDWPSLLQDNLRLVLGAYPFLLALGAAGLALSSAMHLAGRAGFQPSGHLWRVSNPPYGVAQCHPERSEGSLVPTDGRRSHGRRFFGRLWRPQNDITTALGYLPLAILALTGLAVTAYIAYAILERIPHVQDSVTYLFQAKTLALGRLWVPSPPDLDAFQEEFMVNYQGRWFGKYPPGYPLVLAPGVLAGVPWLINPLLFAITLLVLYLTARELWGGPRLGLLAILLALSSPFLLFMSGEYFSHPLGLLLAALLLLGWAKSRADHRWALLTGAAWGWLFLTRPYTAIALGVPFAAWAGLDLLRRRPHSLARLMLLAAPAAAGVAALLAYNTALTGHPLLNPMELYWSFDKVGFGPGFGMSPEGHTIERGLWNTLMNLQEMQLQLFGWPGQLTLALALVPFLSGRATRWDWLLAAMAGSLAVAYVAWWAEGIMYGPRYYYELTGALVLLTARGFQVGGELLQAIAIRGRVAAYLLAGALMLYNTIGYLPMQFELHRGYNFVSGDAIRAVESAGLNNALVFVRTTEQYAWWAYGAVFPANSPCLDTPVVYAQDLGPDRNRALLPHFPGRSSYLLEGVSITPLTDERVLNGSVR